MASPKLLMDNWSLGMKQDPPREQLPKGVCWSATDLIPEQGSPLVKRGGWTRPFNVLGAGSYMTGVGFAAFTAGAQVLMINDAGTLFTSSPGSATVTSRGSARVPAHAPTFYRDQAFICDNTGAAAPYTWDRTTLAALGGSPPNGAVSCAYKDHLVLARSSANKNRVWFSAAGDPASWDTTNRYLDTTYPVFGMAALSNLIVVFSEGFTERITGDIVPGLVGSDMRCDPLHAAGCADPGAIAAADDYIVYANADGVYATDGVALADLTYEGGIKQLWQTLLSGYSSTWTIAGSLFRGRYIVTVLDGSTFKCAFMCDVKRRVWTRLTNLKSIMMASTPVGVPNAAPAIYSADRSSLYTQELASFWSPAAANKNDGDGTAVLPVLETPFFVGRKGRKRWRKLYVTYHMPDAATDNPTMRVSYLDTLAGSYTQLSDTLVETTTTDREDIPVAVASEGIAFKLEQLAASAETRLHSLEAEWLQSEQSRNE